jgi:hypothetical protein
MTSQPPSGNPLNLQTGGLGRSSGFQSPEHLFDHLARTQPATFGNLSSDERHHILGVIQNHAKYLSPGAGFSLSTRRTMKHELEQLREAGKLSKLDIADAHHIIDQLPKA